MKLRPSLKGRVEKVAAPQAWQTKEEVFAIVYEYKKRTEMARA